MANKKSQRARQRTARPPAQPQRPANQATVAPGAQPVRVVRPVRAPSRAAAVKEVNFAEEYHYVVNDLRRIAIYAGGLFVLLIVLALILA